MTKGYVLVEYKWVLLTKFVALFLIVTTFLLLAGGATSPATQVNAACIPAGPADNVTSEGHGREFHSGLNAFT